jgi:lipopolysaccharide assembly LptE-like protein
VIGLAGRPGGRLLILVTIVAAMSGCGYTVGGTLPKHIRTVGVPIFVNRTTEPAVEGLLTRAIVEAFSTNGRLRVVSPAEADAVLEGEVTGYQVASIAFDPRENARQFRLVVTLNVRFRDQRENVMLFEESGLEERADFRVLSAVSDTISREQTALRSAASDIARAVVNRAIQRF